MRANGRFRTDNLYTEGTYFYIPRPLCGDICGQQRYTDRKSEDAKKPDTNYNFGCAEDHKIITAADLTAFRKVAAAETANDRLGLDHFGAKRAFPACIRLPFYKINYQINEAAPKQEIK